MRAPTYDELILDSFFVEIIAPSAAEARKELAMALARSPIAGLDGEKLSITAVPQDPRRPSRHCFDVVPKVTMTPSEAWTQAHAIATELSGGHVEPTFEHARSAEASLPVNESFSARETPPSQLPKVRWHLEKMNLVGALSWLAKRKIAPGEGVTIGHPDTGYSQHREIWDATSPAFDTERARNFVEGGTDARDRFNGGIGRQPGHGTATASVMVSRDKVRVPRQDNGRPVDLLGIAPAARIVPIRVTRTVIILGWQRRLARAIEHAVQSGCDVISISLGGIGGSRLESAIAYAESQGVIVVCAAGNVFPYVIAPAVYPSVVACAASDVDDAPWSDSARGRAVDITAPGHDIWVADFAGKTAVARPGSGTSFSTAAVAAAAALWLCAHRKKLTTKSRIPALFRKALAESARPSDKLPREDYGAGILDCGALVSNGVPSLATEESTSLTSIASMQGYVLDSLLAPAGGRSRLEAPSGGSPSSASVARTFDEGAQAELAFHLMLDSTLRARWRSGDGGARLMPRHASPRLRRSIRQAAGGFSPSTTPAVSDIRLSIEVTVRVEKR